MTYRLETYQVAPDSPQHAQDFMAMMVSLAAQTDQPWSADVRRAGEKNAVLPMTIESLQQANEGAGGLVRLPRENKPRAVIFGTREFVLRGGLQVPELLEKAVRDWETEPGAVILLGGWDGMVQGAAKFKRLER